VALTRVVALKKGWGVRLLRAGPALHGAFLVTVCALPLVLPPLLSAASLGTTSVVHSPAGLGAWLATALAAAQALAIVIYAPWLAAHHARAAYDRRQPAAAVAPTCEGLLLFFVASLPVAIAAWLAGGWDLAAMRGLYAHQGLLAVAFALLGAAAATIPSREWRLRVTLAVAVGGVLSVASVRLERAPLAPRSPHAYLNPGHGLRMFLEAHDRLEDPAPIGEWRRHLFALAALGVVAGAVAFAGRGRRPPAPPPPIGEGDELPGGP
jgi:hypothetical protein